MKWTVAVALALSSSSAVATTYFEQTTKCPVGGKSFKHQAIGSYSTWGALPDGMPVGSGPFPMPRTECPDNGLVLWREFTKADVDKLTPLVNSQAYQALRKTETQSYRVWWLTNEMGERDDAPWTLLVATWEAKDAAADPALLPRYQQAFIDAAMARPVDPHRLETVALRARVVNALRELGRFEDAERERAAIVIAEDARAGETPGDRDAENRQGWRSYLDAQGVVISRRDNSRSPIDMIGEREATFRCASPSIPTVRNQVPALSDFEKTYCARPEIATKVKDVIANSTR